MTVGGSTMGIVTSASRTAARRERRRFSHSANGIPATSRMNVETNASRTVSHRACQSSEVSAISTRRLLARGQPEAVAVEDFSGLARLQEFQVSPRRGVIFAVTGQYRTLFKR